jgi:hypothetical protein
MFNYKITVEALPEVTQEESRGPEIIRFGAKNHDDIFKIVESVRSKKILDDDASAALAVGLKLFSEVVLQHRHNPLFSEMQQSLHKFISQLKAIPAAEPSEPRS